MKFISLAVKTNLGMSFHFINLSKVDFVLNEDPPGLFEIKFGEKTITGYGNFDPHEFRNFIDVDCPIFHIYMVDEEFEENQEMPEK